jgi:hypothetical protein
MIFKSTSQNAGTTSDNSQAAKAAKAAKAD